jgi:hypothetical protein
VCHLRAGQQVACDRGSGGRRSGREILHLRGVRASEDRLNLHERRLDPMEGGGASPQKGQVHVGGGAMYDPNLASGPDPQFRAAGPQRIEEYGHHPQSLARAGIVETEGAAPLWHAWSRS